VVGNGDLAVIDRTRDWRQQGEVIEALTHAMRRRGLLESSIHARVFIVRRWWDFVGDPWRAQRRDVERFIDSIKPRARGASVASASIRYATVSHLHRFYLWARREGLTKRDPTELVERARLRPGLPHPITDTDLALAVTLAPSAPLRAALLLAATSGLRAGEMALLRWDDVDDRSLRVHGKGDRERVVPLHADARDALESLDRRDEWVLPWRARSSNVSPGQRVSYALNQFLHGIGSTATAHSLRHWCATEALASSGDLRAVQELLGHASPATTAIYTRLDPSRLAPIVDAIQVPGLGSVARSGEMHSPTEEVR
jgi:integrase/recombinase XerC